MGELVLIVVHEREARRKLRRGLEVRGYEVIEAAGAIAALELVQRLPTSFRTVVARLDLLGLPGAALVETLRLFRPALPVFCHEGTESVAVRSRCPVVSEGATELDRLLLAFEQGGLNGLEVPALPEPVARRAREQYDRTGDLVQAAREMAGWLVAD